jgi:hypothetical protein
VSLIWLYLRLAFLAFYVYEYKAACFLAFYVYEFGIIKKRSSRYYLPFFKTVLKGIRIVPYSLS